MSFITAFTLVTLLTTVGAAYLGIQSAKKGTMTGKYLSMTCFGAVVVDIAYLGSVFAQQNMHFAVLSSLYFAAIDFSQTSLFAFAFFLTGRPKKGRIKKLFRCAMVYMLFDLLVLAVNPFRNIAISYPYISDQPVHFGYDMHLLFKMHLGFSYLMIGATLIIMLSRGFTEAREFRDQYVFPVLGIVLVVLINACFLFLSDYFSMPRLDYSIIAYPLTAFVLYWSCFSYSSTGMLNKLKMSVFDKVDQGLVLFDYNQNMILHNRSAVNLLRNVDFEQPITQSEFEKKCDLTINHKDESSPVILQCYSRDGERVHPLRCEYSVLTNAQGHKLGQLFIFLDATMVTDPMTGFINWENFKKISRGKRFLPYPISVLVCDINGLSVYNKEYGRSEGDRLISRLAAMIRDTYGQNGMMVRGQEAQLMVLESNVSEKTLEERFEQVEKQFGCSITRAVATAESDVFLAIAQAQQALRNKKMLTADSAHSSLISSLITALQACDNDTEEHVQRTRELGGRLAKRLGLSDIEQSNFSLLCLLHDIGKISVPLEILNKPGKLTDSEWKIIRDHVEKGYQITFGIDEVRDVADMVRHHHERWDGKGYPDGLAGEDIPVLSRLISIVDAFDAMTNDRAYRKAMPLEKAVDELKRCSGTQFDPAMVDVFAELLDEGGLPKPKSKNEPVLIENLREWENRDGKTIPETNIHPVFFSRYILDDHQRIVDIDDHFEILTGYSLQDVRQMKLGQLDLIPKEDAEEYRIAVGASIKIGQNAFMEHKLQRKDGNVISVMCFGRRYFDSSVRRECCEIIITDSTRTYAYRTGHIR